MAPRDVTLEIFFACEDFRTIGTFDIPLLVRHVVGPQVFTTTKCCITYLALMWLIRSVDCHVSIEVRVVLEFLGALWAFHIPGITVND